MLLAGSLTFVALLGWALPVMVVTLTSLTFWCQQSKLKAWLGISVHLLVLLLFNYAFVPNFIARVGLSYYALQNLGVLIAVTRGDKTPYNFIQLLLGNVFFAKYISGPILLPKEINQLEFDNQWQPTNFYYGLNRIVFGVFKKLVIADNLSLITNTVFNHPESEFKAPAIIIATLLFTVEMYVNFSSYTDIALGFARWFNIKLKENFQLPLRSRSIAKYWRKTHISLIDWLTHNFFYYINFKFRKNPKTSVVIGIAITFLLSGVWHGGELGYLIWGALNAIYLIGAFLLKKLNVVLPKFFGWLVTIFIVSFSNLFFRAGYIGNAQHFIGSLKNWGFKWDADVVAILGNGGYLEQQFQLVVVILTMLAFLILERFLERHARSSNISFSFLTILGILIFLLGNFNAGSQFIYMQF